MAGPVGGALVRYAELWMESVAAHAQVGKKTVYRRWPSKAPLVAEAVLEAYGRIFGAKSSTCIPVTPRGGRSVYTRR
jgi:hypothetical protein